MNNTIKGKIEITGEIRVETGLHIGGSEAFSAIGAVDSPVVRDAYCKLPIIPGSSLKGKMRALLAENMNETVGDFDDDDIRIIRLFGSSQKNRAQRGRLIFSDMLLNNKDYLSKKDVRITEVKFENTINRLTSVANPRQIERVTRMSKFDFSLIYNIEKEDEVKEDFETIAKGIELLQYDYLGGHGTRGYGKVSFLDLKCMMAVGDIDEEMIDELDNILTNAQKSAGEICRL